MASCKFFLVIAKQRPSCDTRRMKRILLAAALFAASTVFAAEGWQTNYNEALAQAAKENKLVLVDFTGSDWCSWCIKLDKETFSQQDFKAFAAKNLVLVTIDFPRATSLPPALNEQNEALRSKFGVRGFPTLALVSGTGKPLAINPGYLAGGPSALIAWVNKVRESAH